MPCWYGLLLPIFKYTSRSRLYLVCYTKVWGGIGVRLMKMFEEWAKGVGAVIITTDSSGIKVKGAQSYCSALVISYWNGYGKVGVMGGFCGVAARTPKKKEETG